MFLVLSTSLNPESRSRILAQACYQQVESLGRSCVWFDLAEKPLPMCDGASAYGHPNVVDLAKNVEAAKAIFLASPIYNYDVNAALKNAVELTGQNWTEKVVAMMMAAGGAGSYMSSMGLANSLMLDFRCLIVPRFVYATGDAFLEGQLQDDKIDSRLKQMVTDTLHLADALHERR